MGLSFKCWNPGSGEENYRKNTTFFSEKESPEMPRALKERSQPIDILGSKEGFDWRNQGAPLNIERGARICLQNRHTTRNEGKMQGAGHKPGRVRGEGFVLRKPHQRKDKEER